jgi:hypothetical protein
VTLDDLRQKNWTVKGRPLSGEAVFALYWAIESQDERAQHAALVMDLSDDDSRRYVVIGGRRWDRAISLLKRAGLVSYAGGGRWVALSGRAL